MDNNLILRSNISIKSNNIRSIPLTGSGKIVIKEKHKIVSRFHKNDNTNDNTNDIIIQPLPSYFRTIDNLDKEEKTLIQLTCYSGVTSINEHSVKITKVDESIFDNLKQLPRNNSSQASEIDFNDDTSLESLARQLNTSAQATIRVIDKNSVEGRAFLNNTNASDIERNDEVLPVSDNQFLLLPVSGPDLSSIKRYKMGSSKQLSASGVPKRPEDLIDVLDKDFLELFDKKTLPPMYQMSVHDRVPNPNPNMSDLIRTVSAKSLMSEKMSAPLSPESSKKGRNRPTSPITDSSQDTSKIAIKMNANLDLYNTRNPSPTSAQMVGAHNRSGSPLYHPSSFRRPIKENQDYHFENYDESIVSTSLSIDDLGGNVVKQRSTWIGESANIKFDGGDRSMSPSQSVSSGIPIRPNENPQLNRTPKSGSRKKKYNPVRIDISADDDNALTCATCQSFSSYWCQKCLLSYCPICWDQIDHHFPLELLLTEYQADDVSVSPEYSRLSTASPSSPSGVERSVTSSGGDGVAIKINKPKALKYQDYPEPPIVMDSKGTIHLEKDFVDCRSPSRSRSASPDKYDGDYDYSRPESPGIYTFDPNQGGSRSLEGLSNVVVSKRDPMLQLRLDYIKNLENAKLDVLIKHYDTKQSNEGLFEASRKTQARLEEAKRRIESIKNQMIEEKKKRKQEEKSMKKKGKANIPPIKKKRRPKFVPPIAFAVDAGGCTICPQRQQPKNVRTLKNYSHLQSFPGADDSIFAAPLSYPNDRKELPPPIVATVGVKTVFLKSPLPEPEKRSRQRP